VYSGTTLTPASGRIMGAHQKFDRVARRHLRHMLAEGQHFPSNKMILKFEGKNGPDGIKRKSPAQNEPWHYVNPFDEADTQLIKLIEDHHKALITALKEHNDTKAAFEAAWLAHAIVDGLTPAHHFPYEEELTKLRGGEGLETRTTIMDKVVMPGSTKRDMAKNNWKMWGPKGLLSTHGMFEWGVAAIIKPVSFQKCVATEAERSKILKIGTSAYFREVAKEVAALHMYETYYKTGWTPRLAKQVRTQLAPMIVQMIALSWYSAAMKAATK
jgi:hypothetical protein